jgi:hypothetical protein
MVGEWSPISAQPRNEGSAQAQTFNSRGPATIRSAVASVERRVASATCVRSSVTEEVRPGGHFWRQFWNERGIAPNHCPSACVEVIAEVVDGRDGGHGRLVNQLIGASIVS